MLTTAFTTLADRSASVPNPLQAVGPAACHSRPWRRGAAALLGATALAGLGATAHADQASAVAAPAGVSAAAAQLGEVVVTSRHRSEDAQKIPVALSVVGGDLLKKTNTTNISQISQFVPSLQFSFFNPRNANLNIRGLGNNIGLANDGLEPGVGFYIDQVYYDRPASSTFDLIDIDRIEVLRGPQGTLFGKDSTAGAIVVTTASPSATPSATAEVSGGNFGYFQAKATATGPIVGDVLDARLSVATTQHRGYVTNIDTGGRVNDYHNVSVRGQVQYSPNSDFKLRIIGDYSKQKSNCCDLLLAGIVSPPNGKNFTAFAENFGYTPVVNPAARQVDTNSPIHANQETGGVSVEADWKSSRVALTSISAFRFWNWWPANDSDYTPLSVLTLAQNGDYQTQYSQELRLASVGTNRIDYVVGLYAFREEITAVVAQQYGNAASYFLLSPALPALTATGYTLNANSQYDTTSLAAFGQATWHVTRKLGLTGGLRYTYDHKTGDYNQVASGGVPLTGALAALAPIRAKLGTSDTFSVTDNNGDLSGQVDLSYQASDNVLVYVNYARGYKSGGLNLAQLPAGASAVISPESIDSVEGGVKSRLFDRAVTFNADVFWERDLNYQANIYDPTLGKQYLSNVPEVRSLGVEADLQARPTNDLSLYASGSWDDAIYASYAHGVCGLENITQPYCNLSGAPLAGVARWSFSAGGEIKHPVDLGVHQAEIFAGLDYSFRSSIYSAATDSIYSKLPSLSLLNLRVGVRAADQRWDVTLWAKNIANETYFTFIQAGVGNTGQLVGQLGDPRTLGATLRVHF